MHYRQIAQDFLGQDLFSGRGISLNLESDRYQIVLADALSDKTGLGKRTWKNE